MNLEGCHVIHNLPLNSSCGHHFLSPPFFLSCQTLNFISGDRLHSRILGYKVKNMTPSYQLHNGRLQRLPSTSCNMCC